MSDQQTIERIQQERHTANHAKAYEEEKKESINDLKTIINLQKDRIADLERKVEKYKLGYENLCVVINPSYDENKFNKIMNS